MTPVTSPLRHFVIVASIGRADLLRQTIARLSRQTRRPDGIVVVSVTPADVEGLQAVTDLPLEILFSEKGLPIQRNAGLGHIEGRADIVTFFDDDFLPADDYLETVASLFSARSELVGATGRLIADGISSGGLGLDEAIEFINKDQQPGELYERIMPALYGCNMSFRTAATQSLRFDEALPLYGWQEDVDFSYQAGKRGTLLLTNQLAGVHMGAKGGRTSGKRLGYSQIANPVYLLRKQTIPRHLAWRLMRRNLAANVAGSFRPEPYIDRRGRLLGNVLAIYDLAIGRLHPTRILGL